MLAVGHPYWLTLSVDNDGLCGTTFNSAYGLEDMGDV